MSENKSTSESLTSNNSLRFGLAPIRWAGELVQRQIRAGEDRIRNFGREIVYSLDSKAFVRARVANWFEDEEAMAVKEIIKRPDDPQLVELNAQRYVRTAMAHAEEQTEASSDYIDQIERIMRDSGTVSEFMVRSTVAKLREKELLPLTHIVTMDAIMDGAEA